MCLPVSVLICVFTYVCGYGVRKCMGFCVFVSMYICACLFMCALVFLFPCVCVYICVCV